MLIFAHAAITKPGLSTALTQFFAPWIDLAKSKVVNVIPVPNSCLFCF